MEALLLVGELAEPEFLNSTGASNLESFSNL